LSGANGKCISIISVLKSLKLCLMFVTTKHIFIDMLSFLTKHLLKLPITCNTDLK
jgi:hypothetical protein